MLNGCGMVGVVVSVFVLGLMFVYLNKSFAATKIQKGCAHRVRVEGEEKIKKSVSKKELTME